MTEAFETVHLGKREYVVYFHAGTDKVYEVTTWTTPARGRSRSLRRVWAPISGKELSGVALDAVVAARTVRHARMVED